MEQLFLVEGHVLVCDKSLQLQFQQQVADLFLLDGERMLALDFLYFVDPPAHKDGDLLLGGGVGDEVKELDFFLLDQILPNFVSEFTAVDGLACEVPVDKDVRLLQNKGFLLVEF